MKQSMWRCRVVVVLMGAIIMGGWPQAALAAAPWVKIGLSPQQTQFPSNVPVLLTTQSGGTDLEFIWRLVGEGRLEGSGQSVAYTAPENLGTSSLVVEVSVIVRDSLGREANDAVRFTVIQADPDRGKLSTGTKVAIGAGAAVAVGGGVALAMLGEDDSDDGTISVFGNWSFSGQVLANTCDYFELGLPAVASESLNIQQNGSGLTGTHQLGNVLKGDWTFTGTVAGKGFTLSGSSPVTETATNGCTYTMSAEIDAGNIQDNAGPGNFRINVTAVSGCVTNSCYAAWPGTWTRTSW